MRSDQPNLIVDMTFDFAKAVMNYCDELLLSRRFALSNQLFKSGTSIGANVREAQNAESKADFIHKFKIAAKEADETQYWLELCQSSTNCPSPGDLGIRIINIQKVLSKIISSSKAANNQ